MTAATASRFAPDEAGSPPTKNWRALVAGGGAFDFDCSSSRPEGHKRSAYLQTLGPLSAEDFRAVAQRLQGARLAAANELETYCKGEAIDDVKFAELARYAALIDAAVRNYDAGLYWTVPTGTSIPVTIDRYELVMGPLSHVGTSEVQVALPVSVEDSASLSQADSWLQTARWQAATRAAQAFNALPLLERRRRIERHNQAFAEFVRIDRDSTVPRKARDAAVRARQK